MPLYKENPPISGRMGMLWTLASVKDVALLEYGCMGHSLYLQKWLMHAGIVPDQIYSTHIDERDIALGDTKRIQYALEELEQKERYEGVFLIPSSVPQMIGVDLEAIAMEYEDKNRFLHGEKSPFPVRALQAGNFKAKKEDGMEEAYYALVQMACEKANLGHRLQKEEKPGKQRKTCVIFGNICEETSYVKDAKEIADIMENGFGYHVLSMPGVMCSIKDLENIPYADICIGLNEQAKKACSFLNKKFQIPFYISSPYGAIETEKWISSIEDLLAQKISSAYHIEKDKKVQNKIQKVHKWVKQNPQKAKILIDIDFAAKENLLSFFTSELGFEIGNGGILISDLPHRNQRGKEASFALELEWRKSTLSSPQKETKAVYMGYAGIEYICDNILNI